MRVPRQEIHRINLSQICIFSFFVNYRAYSFCKIIFLSLNKPRFRTYNASKDVIGAFHNVLLMKTPVFLRVRAFFHKTVRVCHVYCNFKIGFTCRITVIFGTLKDGSLLINTLASNICFSYRNMFKNGVDALSKIVDAFLSKSSKFHLVRIIR